MHLCILFIVYCTYVHAFEGVLKRTIDERLKATNILKIVAFHCPLFCLLCLSSGCLPKHLHTKAATMLFS